MAASRMTMRRRICGCLQSVRCLYCRRTLRSQPRPHRGWRLCRVRPRPTCSLRLSYLVMPAKAGIHARPWFPAGACPKAGPVGRDDEKRRLLPELCRPPANGGGHALAFDDLAKPLTELGLGRVERADGVEPGIECGAKAGRIGAAIDRALGRVERLGRNQRQPLGPVEARP